MRLGSSDVSGVLKKEHAVFNVRFQAGCRLVPQQAFCRRWLASDGSSCCRGYSFGSIALLSLALMLAGEAVAGDTVSLRLEVRNAPGKSPITAEVRPSSGSDTKTVSLAGNFKPQTLSIPPVIVQVRFSVGPANSGVRELDLRRGSCEVIYDFKNKRWHVKLPEPKASPALPTNQVSASVEVIVLDATTRRPINGASVRLRSDKIRGSETLSTRFLNSTTNSEGKAVFDSTDLTRSGVAGKATIGRKNRYSISAEASAEGYGTRTLDVGVLVFTRPTATATLMLKTGFRESWIQNRDDERAAKGLVLLSNLPQDNATSWPVVRVLIQDQRGRAVQGATVCISQTEPDRTIQLRTDRHGRAVFTPRDFLVFRFANKDGRAIMRGTKVTGKLTKSEEYAFVLVAEADGFVSSSIMVGISTFAPLAREVFHLQPKRW